MTAYGLARSSKSEAWYVKPWDVQGAQGADNERSQPADNENVAPIRMQSEVQICADCYKNLHVPSRPSYYQILS